MARIPAKQKALLFFLSLFWGLGHFYLGYRLRGISIWFGCITIFLVVTFLVEVYYEGIFEINYILLLVVMALILWTAVMYDIARIIQRMSKQPSNRYENSPKFFGAITYMEDTSNSNKVKCKTCDQYSNHDYGYCYNCGTELQNAT